MRCYLDGQEIHYSQVPESFGPYIYDAVGRTAEGDIVVRLVNVSPLKRSMGTDLAGIDTFSYSGVATVLTSKNLDDENSLTEPTRVVPLERRLPSVESKFQYQLEVNSFTFLKLSPEQK